jgi:hypothetical protein
MRREAEVKLFLEKLLGYLLLFLPGHHLYYRQRELQNSSLGLTLRKRLDSDSAPIRKWVGHGLKFLTIDAYPLGLRVAHSLKLVADFVNFV